MHTSKSLTLTARTREGAGQKVEKGVLKLMHGGEVHVGGGERKKKKKEQERDREGVHLSSRRKFSLREREREVDRE